MIIKVKIQKFNPEIDKKPYMKKYNVEYKDRMTILDVLNEIKDRFDGTLTYRRSCGHAICGSCAVNINGLNRLTCNLQVSALKSKKVTLRPLPGYPVIKDLVIDMDLFFERIEKIKYYLIKSESLPKKEFIQSPDQHKRINEIIHCILCGSCTSSCPTFWLNSHYLGPAAFINAYRYIADNRDEDIESRAKIIGDERTGIFRCHNAYNCVAACPKKIDIPYYIDELKRYLAGKED